MHMWRAIFTLMFLKELGSKRSLQSYLHPSVALRCAREFLIVSDLATVECALVTSYLDCCNVLYVGLPLKMVQRLQLVQNARLKTRTRYREHLTPLL